jgi:diketogulonate reductase-like aldo/keto reductase
VAFRKVNEAERFPINEKTYLLDIIDIPLTETWKALEGLVKRGKVRSIGVSNFSIKNMELVWEAAEIKPVVNQVELHPFFQQKELLDWCSKKVRKHIFWRSNGLSDRYVPRTSCLRRTAPLVTTSMDCQSKKQYTIHVQIVRD